MDGETASPNLNVYCSPAAVKLAGANSQRALFCSAAHASEDGRFGNDNNARTWASVTLVCGYTCVLSLAGIPVSQMVCSSAQVQGSQKDDQNAQNLVANLPRNGGGPGNASVAGGSADGSGGDPCSSAYKAGYHGYDNYKSAKDDRSATDSNLSQVPGLDSNAPVLTGGGVVGGEKKDRAGGGGGAPGVLPAACQSAQASGSVEDRLACSRALDSNFPEFTKDPRFLQEFEQITGHPLQELINRPGRVNLELAPQVLEKSYDAVKEKMSLAEFTANGLKSTLAIVEAIPASERKMFVGELIPEPFKSLLPASWVGPDANAKTSVAPTGGASPRAGLVQAASGVGTVGPSGKAVTSGTGTQAVKVEMKDEDPKLSLFERVSRRYLKSTDRLEKLEWSTPFNHRMERQ